MFREQFKASPRHTFVSPQASSLWPPSLNGASVCGVEQPPPTNQLQIQIRMQKKYKQKLTKSKRCLCLRHWTVASYWSTADGPWSFVSANNCQVMICGWANNCQIWKIQECLANCSLVFVLEHKPCRTRQTAMWSENNSALFLLPDLPSTWIFGIGKKNWFILYRFFLTAPPPPLKSYKYKKLI